WLDGTRNQLANQKYLCYWKTTDWRVKGSGLVEAIQAASLSLAGATARATPIHHSISRRNRL
ncbi:MAG: hypothetical protein ACHQIK_23045, partial [Candidatus Acidiferrales bacterium]